MQIERLTVKQNMIFELALKLIDRDVEKPVDLAISYAEQILNSDKPKIGFTK
jgi:hypothetical protein